MNNTSSGAVCVRDSNHQELTIARRVDTALPRWTTIVPGSTAVWARPTRAHSFGSWYSFPLVVSMEQLSMATSYIVSSTM